MPLILEHKLVNAAIYKCWCHPQIGNQSGSGVPRYLGHVAVAEFQWGGGAFLTYRDKSFIAGFC